METTNCDKEENDKNCHQNTIEENDKAKKFDSLRETKQNLQQSLDQLKSIYHYMNYYQAKQTYEIKTQDYTKLHAVYNELTKNHDQLIEEHEELKINVRRLAIELQNKEEIWEQNNKNNQEIINNLNEKVGFLSQEVESFKSEATQYQSAFGDVINVMNVRWDNENPNNPVNLAKDIFKLQEVLYGLTFLKGKAYVIDEHEIQLLFNRLKTQTSIKHKPSVSAALQRLTIKKIINEYDEYFNRRRFPYNSPNNETLERRLVMCVNQLTDVVKEFNSIREANDITDIKIRQEIYAMLGNRGFGDKGHPFLNDSKKALLKMWEKFRLIPNSTISKEQEDRVEEIILGVIRIFNFRLLTQEPIATFRWFENGDPLDETLMEWVSTGEDETKMVVDICAFPAIGIYLVDPTKCQVYTKAKVQICNIPNVPQERQLIPIKRVLSFKQLYNNFK
ncbi:11250_t:CDS:2 [Ambispora gerdemannii]|uniref:11250_t:CDS:1 n=1 Tax=Ambispora gerdemannii TaxID=144530 RepID=A0A9N8WME1_9GLOM|nr:11250_t:CDS:2 [Ambispora gerdemannii]